MGCEFVPIEAEFDNKQGGEGEGDHTDGGEGVSQVAPVAGPEIEDTAGNEGKGDGIGAGHPLAVCSDLTIARSDEGGGSADHPGGGLHGGSRKTRAAGCESDPREGTNKHGDEIGAAEDAVELEVTVADSRGKIDGPDQKSKGPGECMRDQEMAVRNDL